MTPDPLGFVDGFNVYEYVGNSPVNFVDPYGLFIGDVPFTGNPGFLWNPFGSGGSNGGTLPIRNPASVAPPIMGSPAPVPPPNGGNCSAEKKPCTDEANSNNNGSVLNQSNGGNTSESGNNANDDKNNIPKPDNLPENAVENPNRPGSWGIIGPDGKFEEKWRFDVGKPGASGWGGRNHVHINGGPKHLPPDTPWPD